MFERALLSPVLVQGGPGLGKELAPTFPLVKPSKQPACKALLKCSVNQPFPEKATMLHERLSQIRQARVIACVRAESAEVAMDMARAALDGGLNVLEVTMTTPGAEKAISQLVNEYPSALIGAGTVLSVIEADIAEAAGAKFTMSPVLLKELLHAHCHRSILHIPGAITPTEIFNAYNWGAIAVKLYPVALMGGTQLVQALNKSFCHIPLVASQGIMSDMFDQYLTAGATAVVLSDGIFNKKFVSARDFQKIKQQAGAIAKRAAVLSNQLSMCILLLKLLYSGKCSLRSRCNF